MRFWLKYYFFIFVSIFFSACQNSSEPISTENDSPKIETIENLTQTIDDYTLIDTLEQRLIDAGLVDVQTLNPLIVVDLKYATTSNFLRQNLYGNLRKAYLQKEIAEMLAKAQQYLTEKDSTLHLLVYDAVRPLWVQQKMWNLLDTIPINRRVKFVSNPARGSVHNYACAVDLTVCDRNKIPLDMGAAFDDLRRIAYPIHENEFLKSGELTKKQLENRKLLRSVMQKAGFAQLPTEWWHYNGMNRNSAERKYEMIL
jgi:zinc D-Ala-D-Ala dipeptidase